MSAPEIALFFTGGTSGMRKRDDFYGVAPADAFDRLMKDLSRVAGRVSLRGVEWADLPSPHMTPEHMYRLTLDIERVLEEESIIGVVVVHGTDVMEESAYMADLMLKTKKPVIFTGSMRYFGELGYDGLRNLLFGIKACISPNLQGIGVTLLMADRVFAAGEAVKVHSTGIDPFEAPGLGPLGYVAEDGVHLIRQPSRRVHVRPETIETNVDLIKLSPGMDDRFIQASLDRGAAGLVVEGFGAGNIPPVLVDPLSSVVQDRRIPVILTTRCIQGGVRPIYGYLGGAADLIARGVISGGRLSAAKARILLMLALGITRDVQSIGRFFERILE